MDWYDRPLTRMKLGTIPALVLVHGADRKRMAAGVSVRIKEREGDRWKRVTVDRVADDGYVFASQ
jgi:hypothetical protein